MRLNVRAVVGLRHGDTRAGYDELARQLGYLDIVDMFTATDHIRDLDVGALLVVRESTAGRLRLLRAGQR